MAIRIPLFNPVTGRSVRPDLHVELVCRDRSTIHIPMLVDSGADLSILPVEWVEEYNLAVTLMSDAVHEYRTANGGIALAYRANFQARLMGKKYSWPCLLSLPPAMTAEVAQDGLRGVLGNRSELPLAQTPPSLSVWIRRMFPGVAARPGVLGREGVLCDFELRLDSEYLVLLRRNRLRSWVRSILHRFLGNGTNYVDE